MAEGNVLLTERMLLSVECLSRVRDLIRKTAFAAGCGQEEVDALVIAVNEACANIIRHGYGPEKPGEIILEIIHNQNELLIRLTDFAPTLDPAACKGRALDDVRPGGLGLFFIHELMDRVEFLTPPAGGGNILQLSKKIAQGRKREGA